LPTFGLDPKLTLSVTHSSVLNDQKMDKVFSEDDLGGRIGRKTSCNGMPRTRVSESRLDEKGVPIERD
jgi:hypothetical protein